MIVRRREGLKFVRPTHHACSLKHGCDDVFLFFWFCSSWRCFLESPSALASSDDHPLTSRLHLARSSCDEIESILIVRSDRSVGSPRLRPDLHRDDKASGHPIFIGMTRPGAFLRTYRHTLYDPAQMLDARWTVTQLLGAHACPGGRLQASSHFGNVTRRSALRLSARTHSHRIPGRFADYERCGSNSSGFPGMPLRRISKYSSGAPCGPLPMAATGWPALTASPSPTVTDCMWP
jgi:hypothetical protein